MMALLRRDCLIRTLGLQRRVFLGALLEHLSSLNSWINWVSACKIHRRYAWAAFRGDVNALSAVASGHFL